MAPYTPPDVKPLSLHSRLSQKMMHRCGSGYSATFTLNISPGFIEEVVYLAVVFQSTGATSCQDNNIQSVKLLLVVTEAFPRKALEPVSVHCPFEMFLCDHQPEPGRLAWY
jgi:hypothetical protein